jgi:hypothetical protein
LELRRDKNVFAFVPRKSADGKAEYDAWRCSLSKFDEGICAAVMREDTCYIIDAIAKDPKQPGVTAAQRIMVSSPHPDNFENMFKEGARPLYTPPSVHSAVDPGGDVRSSPALERPS